ncbi:nSTAND1 domain-containing NTPase [Streptomyces tauricus]|uniref:nSTAND1 domain-containing NTPase n=1 Tax=Streptomyces tauricus TaxID=68274 RepID=UPI0034322879
MRQTWLRRTGSELRLVDYHASGGVRGAVAQSAERVYAGSTPAEQRLLRAVFLRLTVLGVGTDDARRRIGRDDTTSSGCVASELSRISRGDIPPSSIKPGTVQEARVRVRGYG